MKKSEVLVITALVLILASLFGYDYLLSNEYLSGRYKDPYRNFVTLKFKDFDRADLPSSTTANVRFVQGPFKVMIDTNALRYVTIKQNGNRLQVNTVFAHGNFYNPNPFIVLISCPVIKEINASGIYRSARLIITDTLSGDDWTRRKILIEGFKQDSLVIHQDYGSSVMIENSTINNLTALLGTSKGSGPKILISKSNSFGHANFDLRNKSQLFLSGAKIRTLNYFLADSAKLVVSGDARNLVKSNN